MIIAEIGLNHLGSSKKLFSMIESLCNSNVDAITLQVREEEFYYSDKWKKFLIDDNLYEESAKIVKSFNKKFGVACSDRRKVTMFSSFVDFYKVLSKDINDEEMLLKIKSTKKDVFISTGNSNFEEISNAIQIIPYANLIHTRLSNEVKDVNLMAIKKMKEQFGDNISFGNHCRLHDVIFAAVSFNPTDYFIYVKDSDYNENIPPDLFHAIDINNFPSFVDRIKEVSLSIGDGKKLISTNQIKGQSWAKKP